MKRYSSLAYAFAATCLLSGSAALAQDTKGPKGSKGSKEPKEIQEHVIKQYDELIIRKKTDKDSKVVVEIKDGKVLVNGKPMEEFEDENISIRRNPSGRIVIGSQFRTPQGGAKVFEFDANNQYKILGSRAFLGVVTEEAPGGARITSVSKGTAAEKAGLKANDIITKINGEKVNDENDVSRLIRAQKPKDKVKLDLLRDGKEISVTAELGENTNPQNFSFSMPETFELEGLDLQGLENLQTPKNFEWSPRGFGTTVRPKIGIKAQDTENGVGVKVLDVESESAAEKSGIEEDDIITEFNDKKVNSADELSREAVAAKDKAKIPVKLLRDGKTVSVDIVIPKKLKTANL